MINFLNYIRKNEYYFFGLVAVFFWGYMVGGSAFGNTPNNRQWAVKKTHWSAEDERRFSEFVVGIAETGCRTMNQCMRGPGNPYRHTDPQNISYYADCADFPYFLRAYFAWKNNLPFSYVSQVRLFQPSTSSMAQKATNGVYPVQRRSSITPAPGQFVDVPSLLVRLTKYEVSTGMFRMHPELYDTVFPPGLTRENMNPALHFDDFYPIRIDRNSVRPGTIVYDPKGHVSVVYEILDNGNVRVIQAHPGANVSYGVLDSNNLVRSRASHGGGLKNWRPIELVGATLDSNGNYIGGKIVAKSNEELEDYSLELYYGNTSNPSKDWRKAQFIVDSESLSYHNYIRAKLSLGSFSIDPVEDFKSKINAICESVKYRIDAVNSAINAGFDKKTPPGRLPENIYGTYGDWETYSSPSRDARLKTAYVDLYNTTKEYLELTESRASYIVYNGTDLKGDLRAIFYEAGRACQFSYQNSAGQDVQLDFIKLMDRIYDISFDPYHCVERRWGATSTAELSTCRETETKRKWYEAQVFLRNQIDRLYDDRMDFTLEQLLEDVRRGTPRQGAGVKTPPEVDLRKLLVHGSFEEAENPLMMIFEILQAN